MATGSVAFGSRDASGGVMSDSLRRGSGAASTSEPLSAYESDALVRVVTTIPRRDSRKSVPLRDVFLDARWSEAVDASPMADYYLSAMTYDEFVHQPKARMLSYRADRVTRFDCAVRDPARVVSSAAHACVPLGCLETPQTKSGWTHLWIDALHHLDDASAKRDTTQLSAWVCLNVTVLPQAWLTRDPDKCNAAFGRAWINRELAFGRVDRDALDLFFEMCVRVHAEQTEGKIWDGPDGDLRGPRLLARLIGRRPRAAASDEASDPDVAIAALEWWDRVVTSRERNARQASPGGDSGAVETRSPVDRRRSVEIDRVANSSRSLATDASGEDTDGECELQLKELMYNLSARQLSDSPSANRAALGKDAALAWHVVCAYASDAFHEPSDAYVCATSVVATACGLAPVRDPLDGWKKKFAARGAEPPRGSDGKLAYRAEDVDVDALDANHETLRVCWRLLAPKADWDDVPECLRGVVHADHARVDWTTRPPGTASLGLGPVPASLMTRGGVAPVGPFFGFDFSRAPNGHRKVGELRGGSGTKRALRTRGAEDGSDADPFPDLETDGVFAPRTYAGEVLRLLTGGLEASGLGSPVTSERGASLNASPPPSLNASRAASRFGSSFGSSFGLSRRTSFGSSFGLSRRTSRAASGTSASSAAALSRSSSGASRASGVFTDSDASDDEPTELAAVDGLASALGKEYMGYHPACRWNTNATARKKNAAAANRAERDEMERTLQNLWRAWIARYDDDGSGTVSLDELRAFASAETCPSHDSYMQTLHEWASNALELGDLDAEFRRVDVDGSGELEYPEFRAMLLTE